MAENEAYGVPIGDVLGTNFQAPALLDGWTALEGIVLVKCLNAEGRSAWALRETKGLNEEEIIGALTVQLDLFRERTKALYYSDEDE